jgi:hypothetical protein
MPRAAAAREAENKKRRRETAVPADEARDSTTSVIYFRAPAKSTPPEVLLAASGPSFLRDLIKPALLAGS